MFKLYTHSFPTSQGVKTSLFSRRPTSQIWSRKQLRISYQS